jgi:ABC-type multidrug transport system ATPase subunit
LKYLYLYQKVSGIAKPGQLMAIMGASGAGKTTLLNVLNFRNRGNLKITGDVKLNGKLIDSTDDLSANSGYVQQDELLLGTVIILKIIEKKIISFFKIFYT